MIVEYIHRIIKYIHHGEVSGFSHLKGKHREYCLCYQGCRFFFPQDRMKNCEIANSIYANCLAFGVTTPVFECPKYESQPTEAA